MYYVYILANRRNGTLYTGVTNQLRRRVKQHIEELNKGFTQKYQVKRLVYYEVHGDVNRAIAREKTIKKWRRKWKLGLIESVNPQWLDLYEVIYKQGNLMCIDPQSKSGRSIVMLKHDKGSRGSLEMNRLDPGSSPG
ncbi:MAG: GIY-YIG nuclease family protein [Planctomycetota bacterium]